MRISDWSSDVCSSDLGLLRRPSTSSRQALWRLAMTVDFFRLSLTLLGPVPALIGITVRPVVPLPRAASAHLIEDGSTQLQAGLSQTPDRPLHDSHRVFSFFEDHETLSREAPDASCLRVGSDWGSID